RLPRRPFLCGLSRWAAPALDAAVTSASDGSCLVRSVTLSPNLLPTRSLLQANRNYWRGAGHLGCVRGCRGARTGIARQAVGTEPHDREVGESRAVAKAPGHQLAD